MSTTDPAGGPVVETPPEHGGPEHGAARKHPSDLQYIYVAIFLAVVTAAEVGVYYVEEQLEGLLVPILVVMAVVKFAVVVLWFMHLRFDSRLFRRLFVTGIILAMFCYMAVLSTFHVWTR